MPALGEEFRSAREARGLSLSDVAERLHIRSVYLAAIEDEDWKAIGAPVYIRGFMRTYARFLGLDAESAVARFASVAASAAPSAPSRVVEERTREEGRPARPSGFAIFAVAVAVAIVAYVAYAYVQYRSTGPSPVAVVSPGAADDAPVAESSPMDGVNASRDMFPSPAPAVKHPVHKHGLNLTLTQTSWLRVAIDGTVVAEGTFAPGTTKTFAGKTADVRVGNAGGVRILVNGRPVGSLGHDGDVVERQFVLSGE